MTTLAVSKDLFVTYARLVPGARGRVEQPAITCWYFPVQDPATRGPVPRTLHESEQWALPGDRSRDNHRRIMMPPDCFEKNVLVDLLPKCGADR